jgi:hypothetical protein
VGWIGSIVYLKEIEEIRLVYLEEEKILIVYTREVYSIVIVL